VRFFFAQIACCTAKKLPEASSLRDPHRAGFAPARVAFPTRARVLFAASQYTAASIDAL